MRLFPSSTGDFLMLLSSRFYSSTTSAASAASTLNLKNLPYRNRPRALAEAKLAITDYLHATSALPFALADHIASNSPVSLRSFVSQIPFDDASPSDFRRILRHFLAYHPVNEFDFFFESIGLHPSHPSFPSGISPFLSDDARLLAAVSSLLRFGFPCTLLGNLYLDSPSIFSSPPGHLLHLLRRFEGLGLPRLCVIAICLTFPCTLHASDHDVEAELLCRDLKILFLDYGLAGYAGDDVHAFLRFCRRIRVFYDFGLGKGGMGELLGCNRRVFLEFDEFILAQRLNFLQNLGMCKEEVGLFTLNNPEILDLDLDNADIVMPDYLIRAGLGKEEADSVTKKYSYVMGKNKVKNLPAIMKALNLNKWFFTKIVHEKNLHFLSLSHSHTDSFNTKLESEFLQNLERIKLVKRQRFIDPKAEFFLSIGLGKNKSTSKAIWVVSANKEQLQERFDCLIGLGIEHSMLCRMIATAPKLLNQSRDMLLEKTKYLCHDLGYPIEYLNTFPAFLFFNLENRIKPRYKILNWLRDSGLMKKPFAPATVVATSEKKFIFTLSIIHPEAPKLWLEFFSSQKGDNGDADMVRFSNSCSCSLEEMMRSRSLNLQKE
ncbi:hypothetical protein KSP40_PGU019241 [Platanthera guangdongensis]|uniref:Transcription termination factor MTEF18, mitochondrial n=1 Tax=Platanthera guangdongensis TaxID=2320717 RepID=A0ABR2LC21_9ASPA